MLATAGLGLIACKVESDGSHSPLSRLTHAGRFSDLTKPTDYEPNWMVTAPVCTDPQKLAQLTKEPLKTLAIHMGANVTNFADEFMTGLSAMTNLEPLDIVSCRAFPPGVLASITDCSKLRSLQLLVPSAPKEEYDKLTNLVALQDLRLQLIRNYHDQALLMLTNLPVLSKIELNYTSVTPSGADQFLAIRPNTNLTFTQK